MAANITAYGLTSTSHGPYFVTSGSVTDIASLPAGTGSNNYVVGFVDGEQKAKFFYSASVTTDPYGQIALPVLAAPNALPSPDYTALDTSLAGWTGSAAAAAVYQAQPGTVLGVGTALGYGGIWFGVSYTAGSPDAGSPGQFFLDVYGILLISTAPYSLT